MVGKIAKGISSLKSQDAKREIRLRIHTDDYNGRRGPGSCCDCPKQNVRNHTSFTELTLPASPLSTVSRTSREAQSVLRCFGTDQLHCVCGDRGFQNNPARFRSTTGTSDGGTFRTVSGRNYSNGGQSLCGAGTLQGWRCVQYMLERSEQAATVDLRQRMWRRRHTLDNAYRMRTGPLKHFLRRLNIYVTCSEI